MGTLRDLCAVGWFDEPEQQRHQQIFPEKRQKLARHFQRVPCTQNGVPEPLVSAGKLVRDDDGQPIAARRYSDHLLLALLKAHRPPRWEGQCASNCRHFDPLLMQRAQWRRLPPGLRLAK